MRSLDGVALEVFSGLMTASVNLSIPDDNGQPDDRLLGELPTSLLGELYLHKLLTGLYSLLALAYIIFICTSRRISRIEIGILVLMVAKTLAEFMTVAQFMVWDVSGAPSETLGFWIGIIGSLTTTLFYSLLFLSCHGWRILPGSVGTCTWICTALLALVSSFVYVYMAALILQINRSGNADHMRPLIVGLSIARSILVIVYATWSALATRRTQRYLAGSETVPAITYRFAKFRCKILVAVGLYIMSSGYMLWFQLWSGRTGSNRDAVLLRLVKFATTVADILVLVSLAVIWQSASQHHQDGFTPVLPEDDVELSELETSGRQDYKDDEDDNGVTGTHLQID
eukprot:scaffold4223_cov189-Amphora_coffeaeformis.AAC.31